jgi:AcrR family transcriptional regulator
MTRRERAPAERRAAILIAAARLFQHYGHAKTTIADIAREAQVAVGSVYLEFASKEEIVLALSCAKHDRILEAMRRAGREGATFQERFVVVLEERITRMLELRAEGEHGCELIACTASGVQSARARFLLEEQAFLRALLEQGRDEGALAGMEPRSAAAVVQRAFASLSPPLLFEYEAHEARRHARELAELLLRGLLARADAVSATRAKTRR